MLKRKAITLCATLALMVPAMVMAELSQDAIAKATQNPLTAMYSVPIQNNTYFNIGPADRAKNITNIQPVLPYRLNDDWTLVSRIILPLVDKPDNVTAPDSSGRTFGLGDTTVKLFFTPTDSGDGDWVWGAGPVFYLPTATDDALGTRKWGAGPAFVTLRINGRWVYGGLFVHVWSFAGEGQSSGINRVNLTTIQPFVNYNLDDGWFISSVPIITANWEASSGNEWTVPMGVGFGRAMRFGSVPGAAQIHAYYNVATPEETGEEWQLRLQIQFLFPR